MRLAHPDGQLVHLGYCTNVHPAEDLAGILAQLDSYAVPVREHLDVDVLSAVLLGELWLRTITRFQDGFLACLADAVPDADARTAARAAARTAARQVVDWCRANPDQARLLLYARRDFAPDEWPAGLTARAATQDRRLRAALRALAVRLGADLDQVVIAVVDLPYAVVRRHLTGGGAVPTNAADQVETCAGRLLDP